MSLIFQNHDKKGMINDGNISNRKTNLIWLIFGKACSVHAIRQGLCCRQVSEMFWENTWEYWKKMFAIKAVTHNFGNCYEHNFMSRWYWLIAEAKFTFKIMSSFLWKIPLYWKISSNIKKITKLSCCLQIFHWTKHYPFRIFRKVVNA